MKNTDQLAELFRERFAGHEMDAPADAWAQIDGQLAAGNGEGLREALQEKFQGHEVEVDPSAWAHISGQLGHVGAAGGTVSVGWIAAGVTAVAITAGVLLWGPGTEKAQPEAPAQPITELVETPAAIVEEPVQEAPSAPVEEVVTVPSGTPEPSRVEAAVPASTEATEKVSATDDTQQPDATGTTEGKEAAADKAVTEPAPPISKPQTPPATTPGTVATPPALTEPASEPEQPIVPGTAGEQETGVAGTGERMPPESDPSDDAPASLDLFGETPMEQHIFIPNVFTPQGDGINDVLEIVVTDHARVDVKVYSTKTGALVFHTNDLDNQWDGRLPNGNNADEGHYQCVVRVNFNNGRSETTTELVRLYR